MKLLLPFLALFTLTFSPVALAQEGDELDDLIIDDFGDGFGDDLFIPEEDPAPPTEPDPSPNPGDLLAPPEDDILDPFDDGLIEEPDPISDPITDPTASPDPMMEENFQSSAGVSGNLPSTAMAEFTVRNVSQDNADAETVGSRPGDVLRYELKITSDTEDVKDYVASINVSNVLVALDFTDTGLGVLENGMITYPAYSNAAPCEQVFTFFAQVKPDCGEIRTLNISAEGDSTAVGTSCELSQTGPAQRFFLLAGIAILMISLVLGMSWRGKTT